MVLLIQNIDGEMQNKKGPHNYTEVWIETSPSRRNCVKKKHPTRFTRIPGGIPQQKRVEMDAYKTAPSQAGMYFSPSLRMIF